MAQRNPLSHTVHIWNEGLDSQIDDVREDWPELAKALDALAAWSDHVVTDPSTVHVPPLARPATATGSSSRSAGRLDLGRTQPTSGGSIPGQLTLPINLGE